MTQLICEMCGGTTLIKQDGVYVCQSCGTKYSVEEAKKMMVEGTVKIDNSERLKNYYSLARQAKECNDAENAVKYYDLIKQEDPNSWEACFYNVYFRAVQTKIMFIQSAANSINNCLGTVFELIKNASDSDEEKKAHILEVVLQVTLICVLFESSAKSALNKCWCNTSGSSIEVAADYSIRTLTIADVLFKCGDLIEQEYRYDAEMMKSARKLWESGIEMWKTAYALFDDHANRYSTMRDTYVKKIHHFQVADQDSYVFSAPQYSGFPDQYVTITKRHSDSDFGANSSGGCYVATAVYGSYDCPQVWALRRYRDYTLAETWHGRAFIHAYYAISPTLVKWFGHTEWFKKMWKGKLDRMVENLRAEGVEDTPYVDRKW